MQTGLQTTHLSDHENPGQKETTETLHRPINATPPTVSAVPSSRFQLGLRLTLVGGDSYRRKPPIRTPTSPQLPDPYTLNHIVPFTYFCDWYKTTNARTVKTEPTPEEMQDIFLTYREDLLARTAKDFCREHSNEPWFREKYDPVLGAETKGKLVEYRRWLYGRFMEDLEDGKLDDVDFDGAAARRYFAAADAEGKNDEGVGMDEVVASSALGRMPPDPMADNPTPCIKTVSTAVTRLQLEAVRQPPIWSTETLT
jgi:SERRATE/Ars2, N-terminal domain